MRIVMKIGGALDGDGQMELARVLRNALKAGDEIVLVHGGGPEISRRLAERKIELPFVDGLRITTDEAIDTVVEALQFCNEQLNVALRGEGLPIVSFVDGVQVVARDIDMARTGAVDHVDPAPILSTCTTGKIPLFPPYGLHADGRMFNLNADTTAAKVAQACEADKLVFCTNVSGVFTDSKLTKQLFDVKKSELVSMLNSGAFADGMIPKVESMMTASDAGLREVWVVDGTNGASLDAALKQTDGTGDGHRTTGGTCLLRDEVSSEVF